MSESVWWFLFHKKSEGLRLRLYNDIYNSAFSNLDLKAVSSNASPG
jgi:hypothetical protein